MAFPQTPLPIKVELRLGSTWTDVTPDVRGEQQIRITRGRADEAAQTDTMRCTFTLDNNTGTYTPRNPSGPYYGLLGRNTPCRVSVMAGSAYLDMPGSSTADYALTPHDPSLAITGDIDVRLDATLVNWLPPVNSGATVEMIGKMSGVGQKSWFLGSKNGRLYFEWSSDGTNTLAASSTIPPVIPGSGRLAVRVWLDVDNGAGGSTVRFYTSTSLDGTWTLLGDPVTQTGTTGIFNSTAPVRIGNATVFTYNLPLGGIHSAEIRNGEWGTIAAQPYFSQQAVGIGTFVDSAGRTWTMSGGSQITNRRTRFVGEVSAWPVRWETKQDVVVNVEASGILRRLSQGASPVRSPMYREFTNASRTGIVAYWPMEDEASATTFGSALDGSPAMRMPAAGVTAAAYTGWAASEALPVYSFGTTSVKLPSYAPTGFIFTRLFIGVPAAGVTGTDRLFSFTTSGTARTWAVTINPAGSLQLQAFDADGLVLVTSGFGTFAVNGMQRMIAVELTQNGANIDWKLWVFKIESTTLTFADATTLSGTLTGYTCGAAMEARIGQLGLLNGTGVGHMAFASSSSAYGNTHAAMIGWNGEVTSARLYRLGIEELSPCFTASISEEQMGVQGTSTLVELMREAESADEGILLESRAHYPGWRFRDHVSLYSQTPGLVLDYTGTSGLVTPLEPTDDDQNVRNDRTVTRTNGSSTRRTLDSGPLSTQAPPNGVGRYTDSVTENLYSDAQTGEHAGWLLHLGTWDETRYPVVRMVLSKAPGLIEAAAGLDVGDRMQITNPPSWLPPDTIDLMVQGYSETLDQFTWNIDFNCTPAAVWDVAWAGDATQPAAGREFQWADTDGSQLTTALSQTDTTAVVTTTAGPLWTPNVRDTPFDWRVAGEVMTVTAPGTLLNANPFFDQDVTGWSAQSSSISWSQTYVCPHPRAKGSLRIVPNGTSAQGSALATLTPVGSITPGASYTVSLWAFSVNGWSSLQPAVNWHDAGGAYLSTGSTAGFAVPASRWTYLEQTVTAPANASRASVLALHSGTPSASDVWYAWAVRITRARSSWLYDSFSRTSANSWGTSDSGLAWSNVGGGVATDYTLSGSYASHVLSTLNDTRRSGIAAVSPDFDIYCDMTASAAATGDSLYGAVCARMQDASNMYMLRAEFATSGSLFATVRKMVAGTQTQLGTYTAPVGYSPGTFVRFRFQGTGTGLRAKAWRTTDVEPGVWHIDTTDTAITAANQIGTRSVRVTGNTNAATAEIRYDNFEVTNPQTYTVTRSTNRVVKAQSAGAPVALAYPAYTAL
ncbi:carbohydrate binding domain-containing protein [Streptomyces shenzhenensis]|uniref:carbohydrate binding domain-containing protein n=1 Tax=Streptomyces shenzhenensis TaxID=943815 RepID=UPI0036966A37